MTDDRMGRVPPVVYSTPNWLTQESAWVMHIPFAFLLVEALRPRTIVELGVHAGDSYCAWCQAVDALSIETRCYGVDTWAGDAHAGAYEGERILSSLRRHHDPRYGRFSQLIPATFDEALEHVEDGSIDLLHVDGFHTYEAVSHDFESWKDKLSERAVVLFHDTNVREADFGVHRYWREIADRYPSFEFPFGHGLGVLGVGASLPPDAQRLFEHSDAEREDLGRLLAALGERVTLLSGFRRIDEIATRLGWPAHTECFGRITVDRVEGLLADGERAAVDAAEHRRDRNASDSRERELRAMLAAALRERDVLQQRVTEFSQSASWRVTAPLRRIRRKGGVMESGDEADDGPLGSGGSGAGVSTTRRVPDGMYRTWFARYSRPRAPRSIDAASGPLISIVVPVYAPDMGHLERAIASVRAQTYQRWELCIADDASPDPAVGRYLEDLARGDARIRVTLRPQNGHISACSNSALQLCTGDYVALLDQDDELSPDALALVAGEIVAHPEVDVLYSDEDKIDETGRHYDPYFKPEFDPVLLLGQNYVSHLGVYRRRLLDEIGGFREGFEGSQDHDLVLRCLRVSDRGRIRHLPFVLYHWRAIAGSTAHTADEKPYARDAARRAVEEHLEETGVASTVRVMDDGYLDVRPLATESPSVTIVIPTKNGAGILRTCVESIRTRTTYPSYDLLIVDNGSDDPAARRYLKELEETPGVTVIRDDGPFNYSRINNEAVRRATGEFVVLLNNDTEIVTPEWLDVLVGWGVQPGVGSVGCKLLYPDDTLQHAGVVLGIEGVAGHAMKGLPADTDVHFSQARLAREVGCSTAACLLVRRDTFLSVGGLDEDNLPVAFNDVDLGLRLLEAGLHNVWTPAAVLYHHESKTRGSDERPERREGFNRETRYMKARWAHRLNADPYYNPNFSLTWPGHELAFPPRERLSRTG